MGGVHAMAPSLFRSFRRIARDRAGIEIGDGKEAMVAARVAKRQRALGIDSQRSYLRYLEQDTSGLELISFLDVISTKFTGFFREPEHFELLARRVRELVAQGQTRVRLWSAACATGEEPYSMAIAVSDILGASRLDLRILATDMAPSALEQARQGLYPPLRVLNLSRGQLCRHFTRHGRRGTGNELYEINPALRRLVVLKRLNLAEPRYPMSGPLQVILCRNVLMYLGREVRQGVVNEVERLLAPGGLLMTGHAETLSGIEHRLTMVRPSIYQKAGPGRILPARRPASA